MKALTSKIIDSINAVHTGYSQCLEQAHEAEYFCKHTQEHYEMEAIKLNRHPFRVAVEQLREVADVPHLSKPLQALYESESLGSDAHKEAVAKIADLLAKAEEAKDNDEYARLLLEGAEIELREEGIEALVRQMEAKMERMEHLLKCEKMSNESLRQRIDELEKEASKGFFERLFA